MQQPNSQAEIPGSKLSLTSTVMQVENLLFSSLTQAYSRWSFLLLGGTHQSTFLRYAATIPHICEVLCPCLTFVTLYEKED